MEHIVCFGDSITQRGFGKGWVSRLAEYYVRTAHVINCGLSGYNSRWYVQLLQDEEKCTRLIPPQAKAPLFATLLLGSNDLATNEQGVPLGEYIANMEAILRFIHTEVNPQYGIFLLTPPPVDEEAWMACKQLSVSNRTLAATRLYRSAVLDIAANFHKNYPEVNVVLVDTHSAILHHACPATAAAAAADHKWEPSYDPKAPWTTLLEDGLHINDVGGAVFFATLVEAMRTSIFAEQLDPAALPWMLPAWQDVAEVFGETVTDSE